MEKAHFTGGKRKNLEEQDPPVFNVIAFPPPFTL